MSEPRNISIREGNIVSHKEIDNILYTLLNQYGFVRLDLGVSENCSTEEYRGVAIDFEDKDIVHYWHPESVVGQYYKKIDSQEDFLFECYKYFLSN